MKNQHITEFLSYYLDELDTPEYAVMINAKWGAGKTHFIKHFLENHFSNTEKKPYLFISLYGLSTFAEIDDAIFTQAHPILSSKGMAVLKSVVKTGLKFTTQIDITGDNKPDVTVNSQIPDIKLSDWFATDTKDAVLVFDDLERCAIEVSNLLGYLNYFVEHGGHKMILIANEEELVNKQDDSDLKYQQIKEKLIGKTFSYQAIAEDVIHLFIKDFSTKNNDFKLYSNQFDKILSLFKTAGYYNFRVLKQCLYDFERLYSLLDTKVQSNPNLISDLLADFIVFYLEDRSGELPLNEILSSNGLNYFALNDREFKKIEKSEEQKNEKIREFSKKYASHWKNDTVLPAEIWEEIIQQNIISKEEINKILLQSKYFKKMPSWYYLSQMYGLSEEQCQDAFSQCVDDIRKNNFNIEDLLHLYDLFCFLEEVGIRQIESAEMLQLLEAWVDKQMTCGTLPVVRHLDKVRRFGQACLSSGKEKFEKFYNKLQSNMQEQIQKKLPEQAQELLSNLRDNPQLFYSQLTENQDFFDYPILSLIEHSEFINLFLTLDFYNQSIIEEALNYRFTTLKHKTGVQQEKEWCTQLLEAVQKEKSEHQGRFSILKLNRLESFLQTEILRL